MTINYDVIYKKPDLSATPCNREKKQAYNDNYG